MSDLLQGLSAALSGMNAQATRLRIVSENIANADTPGFHRKAISFESLVGNTDDSRAVAATRVTLDQRPLEQVYDPAHPLADEEGYHDGSNVDMMIEIADAREAQRSYEANLRMFDQSRRMLSSLFELLRR
ncbi:flagellar basal body rod protein FlgC [Pikeienuella piscinae]|uniref:Flagellar basal body rod protein FlgB n=1 Tax=Pikeienuella piscinae TaxID=2748098 RepID=A0A7L5C3X3_9RHOB|nr:flagellar basal body rod protein FlgC [Pikeienuella piscinae]QIE56984.1 flagellar basal body rod protein FlgC [Pikeienuella piscinae]